MRETTEELLRQLSNDLIKRGIHPDKKLYKSVRPKGLLLLSPRAWRSAKIIEKTVDTTHLEMMASYERAIKLEKENK